MSVTLKIPYDPAALKAASEFFAKLAEIPPATFGRVLGDVPAGTACEPIPVTLEGTVIDELTLGRPTPEEVNRAVAHLAGLAPTPTPDTGAKSPTGEFKEWLKSKIAPIGGVITDTSIPTPTPDTGAAPAPSVSPETVVSPTVNPAPPAPVIPVPPAEPTVAGPDAATVFGSGVSLPPDSLVPQDSGWQPPPTPTVDIDSRGLPWDGRIHAATRAKITDGSWRNKKCPAEYQKPQWDEFILKVEDELRAAMALPGPVPPCDGLTGSQLATVTTVPVPPTPTPTPTPTPIPTPVAPVVPPPAGPMSLPKTFAELNVAITSNAIDRDRVNQAVQSVGLQAYPLLAARPDLIPAVAAVLFP